MSELGRDPVVHRLLANGLEHRVLEWPPATGKGSPERKAPGSTKAAMLLHGFMDAGATWDRVAVGLAQGGLRVLAPDFRGFGDGPRVPAGGYYHFPDYVADVAALLVAAVGGEPVFLVGHSMGGTVATLYAGAFPERVAKLALLEGLGPPPGDFGEIPVRMRRWIEQVDRVRSQAEKAMRSMDEAYLRLSAKHGSVAPETLRERLPQLAHETADGRVCWRADPLHRTPGPVPFSALGFAASARCVTCPVLIVSGGPTGLHLPDEAERLAAFETTTEGSSPRRLDCVELPGAGHMMHWTRPRELVEALLRFWDE